MLSLAIVVGVFALTGFFLYLSINSAEKNPFRFLFYGLFFFFLMFGVFQLSILPGVPQTLLNSTNESSLYWNCTFNITEPATCGSVNVSYYYGNYSSGYEHVGEAFSSAGVVLMWLVFLIMAYMMLMFILSALNLLGKKNEDGGNDYARPF